MEWVANTDFYFQLWLLILNVANQRSQQTNSVDSHRHRDIEKFDHFSNEISPCIFRKSFNWKLGKAIEFISLMCHCTVAQNWFLIQFQIEKSRNERKKIWKTFINFRLRSKNRVCVGWYDSNRRERNVKNFNLKCTVEHVACLFRFIFRIYFFCPPIAVCVFFVFCFVQSLTVDCFASIKDGFIIDFMSNAKYSVVSRFRKWISSYDATTTATDRVREKRRNSFVVGFTFERISSFVETRKITEKNSRCNRERLLWINDCTRPLFYCHVSIGKRKKHTHTMPNRFVACLGFDPLWKNHFFIFRLNFFLSK